MATKYRWLKKAIDHTRAETPAMPWAQEGDRAGWAARCAARARARARKTR